MTCSLGLQIQRGDLFWLFLQRPISSIASITEHFKLSRNAINKHLHILTDAKLVTKKEIGRETIYDLNVTSLLLLEDWLEFFDKYWEN